MENAQSTGGSEGTEPVQEPQAKPSPPALASGEAVMEFIGSEVETLKLAWSAIDQAIREESFARLRPLEDWMRVSWVLGKLVAIGRACGENSTSDTPVRSSRHAKKSAEQFSEGGKEYGQ